VESEDATTYRPFRSLAELVNRMEHACLAAFDLQEFLKDDRWDRVAEQMGAPLFDLVTALSVLYEEVNIEFDVETLDS
jgi:hypothetical protein